MSCSITITERLRQMRCSSSAVSSRSRAHAGDRLVEHQQLGLLHQQHADLQPLLLAVRAAGLGVEPVAQADLLGHRLHARARPRCLKASAPNTLRPAG
jgi:hypothetical protein